MFFSINDLSQTYKTEYTSWNQYSKSQEAKRQEFFRKNPGAIKDYDLQRAKILLKSVDMMDRAVSLNSGHINTVVSSISSMGLGYAAVLGAALGLYTQKLGLVQNCINKIVNKVPKSKNIISMGITTLSGVLGVVAAYPVYSFFSRIESNIDRKKRFEMMENELQDPKIFAVLDATQKEQFEKNIDIVEKTNKIKTKMNPIQKNLKSLNTRVHEVLYYNEEQENFRKKYQEDKSFYDASLTEQELKDAKKDKVLLCVLIKELNAKAQSYEEKIQKITDNLIALAFALGSLFTLGYERIAQKMKFRTSALPASMGIFMMLGATCFATWAQKRASHVGRFKAKQELMSHPESLVYVSQQQISTVETDSENKNNSKLPVEVKQKSSMLHFIKEFFKHNNEYQEWKKTSILTGKDISKSMNNINLSPEQLRDGERLKTNMFKTFYKVDSNTQNYSSQIDAARESAKYPIMLVLGTIGSMFGLKHLVKLRNAKLPNEMFKESMKYIATISLFTLPTLAINSYFANVKKMAARISDMMTMKDLEDPRFFADYSRIKQEKLNSSQEC